MTSDDIIRAIYECVPAGSCEPNDCGTVSRLRALTADLLRDYETSGFLERHPFSEASSRRLHGEHLRVEGQLANKTVLVRGGEGTVGRYLISTFHPRRLQIHGEA
jgi:FlaA1/EpsC-like NDP-sugar epimerase